MSFLHLALGFAGSGALSAAAYRYQSLSASGAVAATLVGGAMYAFGSAAWYVTLLVFFLTSTSWSKWRKHRKWESEGMYEKGSRRDAGQVFANGGLAAALCITSFIWPHDAWWFAFVGVMASVNADTWATEIGGLSRADPRSIVTLRRVPRGTSGGVSPLGSLAAATGALTIGAAALLLAQSQTRFLAQVQASRAADLPGGAPLLIAALVGGLAGSFADSLIGATLQRMNRCVNCGAAVEQPMHCGSKTVRLRGIAWMNNDAVNAISSALGGAVALAVGAMMGWQA